MITCCDGHDEVAFDNATRHCPVCIVIKDLESLEQELEAEQSKVAELEQQLDDAKAK